MKVGEDKVKVLVVASQKGGVGKTTISLNLAYAMANRGWRTLLVDTDPQGAIGLGLTEKISQAPGLAEFTVRREPLSKLVIKTRLSTFRLLTLGQMSAQYTPQFNAALADGSVLHRLIQEAQGDNDLMLIDTPCGFGGSSLGALRVCDFVLSPVQAEPVALRSIPQILEVVAWLQEEGYPLQIVGLLVSMFQSHDETSAAVVEEIRTHFPEQLLFKTVVPRDPSFLKASAAGVPLGLLSRRPPAGARVFEQLAFELEERLAMYEESNDGPISLVD